MGLRDKAMLVSISVTKPQMQKRDKQTSREVAFDKDASEQAVSVINKLYPKHLISPIQEVESAARRYVESVTQPYARGLFLLPSALFMMFQEQIGVFKLQYDQAVTVFLNNYAGVLVEAQKLQGTMFDSNNYPDMSDMRKEFSFGVKYLPMGNVPSIMLGLEAQVATELRTEIENQVKASLADGQQDLYKRLAAAITRIKVQCSKPDGKIYDSLTGNLDEMLKVLPALNLADDATFADLCEEARTLVVNPVAIKTIPEVRENMATRADEILKKMAGFL
jgi:hypothetical protein